MAYKFLITAAVAATICAPAMAQNIQLNGVSVEGSYRSFIEDDVDVNSQSLKIGAEIGFYDRFALGANLGLYTFGGDSFDGDESDFDTQNLTLHAMYMTSSTAAFGFFGTQESNDSLEVEIYGLEFASRTSNAQFDVYYGITDLEFLDEDSTIGGFSMNYALARGFTAGLSYDSYYPTLGIVSDTLEIITVRQSDFAVSVGYDFGNGLAVTGKLGQIYSSASDGDTNYISEDPEAYINIAAQYNFGKNGGTLMDNRTYLAFGS